VPEGDLNTIYFHSVANGTNRKKLIHSLIQEEGTIEGHEQMKSYTTSYYKGLFRASDESDVSLDESRIDDIPQVSQKKTLFLLPLFTRGSKEGCFSYETQ
jgi:hypothetical protein